VRVSEKRILSVLRAKGMEKLEPEEKLQNVFYRWMWAVPQM
jgi:hypothetical protein